MSFWQPLLASYTHHETAKESEDTLGAVNQGWHDHLSLDVLLSVRLLCQRCQHSQAQRDIALLQRQHTCQQDNMQVTDWKQ